MGDKYTPGVSSNPGLVEYKCGNLRSAPFCCATLECVHIMATFELYVVYTINSLYTPCLVQCVYCIVQYFDTPAHVLCFIHMKGSSYLVVARRTTGVLR